MITFLVRKKKSMIETMSVIGLSCLFCIYISEHADREEREGLNLRYYVNIYGEGPRLLIFRDDDNLATGPVPYGAPTHQEFMQFWTPQEFSSPPADLTTVMQWLAERLDRKKPR